MYCLPGGDDWEGIVPTFYTFETWFKSIFFVGISGFLSLFTTMQFENSQQTQAVFCRLRPTRHLPKDVWSRQANDERPACGTCHWDLRHSSHKCPPGHNLDLLGFDAKGTSSPNIFSQIWWWKDGDEPHGKKEKPSPQKTNPR